MTKLSRLFFLGIAAIGLAAYPALFTVNADDAGGLMGFGSVAIEQVGPEDMSDLIGSWTLINPRNEQTKFEHALWDIPETQAGNYTFIADPPEGTTANVQLIVNGETISTVDRQQISFTLHEGENVRIVITYNLEITGTVSVTSVPKGLDFTLKGPNATEFKGTTPGTFQNVAIGQYTVYFDPIEGCVTPKPKSDHLEENGRITLTISVSCDNLAGTEQGQDEQRALEYVTVTIDGLDLIFNDAPITAWYATYVHTVAKTGILRGYLDENGNYTGTFGVNDNVTLAQLAKIAHELAGMDEQKVRVEVRNRFAPGTWFERYFASAEQRWWTVFQNKWDNPNRAATRSEVVSTILQVMDIPRYWPKGKTFSDILPTTKYAAAIETAAIDGMIGGYADGSFKPDDPVNRAELAKIVTKAIEIYGADSPEITGEKN